VTFHAVLGNHDDPDQRFYRRFKMGGHRYYTFDRGNARFFALDSNYMDPAQLDWATRTLCGSNAEWKIVFMHHPLYSSADRHGSDVVLRKELEPLLVDAGVDVVLAGHDHVYERMKPQKGIHYFISGPAGELAREDVEESPIQAAAFDRARHFMLFEIAGDKLLFQAISSAGRTLDSGEISPPRV
jgi:3',5'-cyclic AMP phosphodiesterase CpdA